MLFWKNKRLSGLYIVFIAVYLAQTLLFTPDKATLTKYHLDATQLKLLGLTVALPYIAIWIIALVGYLRLNAYVKLIDKDKDGIALKTISQGILWLSLWLPLSTLIPGFLTQFSRDHQSATASIVRLENYLFLVVLFVGFWLVHKGSQQLLQVVKKKTFITSQTLYLAYIIFAALYVLLTLKDPARQHPTSLVPVASYYEPDWLLTLTLTIPRLIYWFIGLQAVQNIYLYRTKVKGKVYKEALTNLAVGLSAVVGMIIVLRCFQSLSGPLAQLSLAVLLVIVYLLLILISIGYVLIAKGAKRLQKLEEL